MGPDEWDELPWYIATAYLTGLHEQGIIGNGQRTGAEGSRPAATPAIDLTEPGGTLGLGGFSTRSAG